MKGEFLKSVLQRQTEKKKNLFQFGLYTEEKTSLVID